MNTENTTATSKASHAGDSTTQNPEHDTGVGSGVWFGNGFEPGSNLDAANPNSINVFSAVARLGLRQSCLISPQSGPSE